MAHRALPICAKVMMLSQMLLLALLALLTALALTVNVDEAERHAAAARFCSRNGSSDWCKRARAAREARRLRQLQRRTVSKDKDCSIGSGWDEYEVHAGRSHSSTPAAPKLYNASFF